MIQLFFPFIILRINGDQNKKARGRSIKALFMNEVISLASLNLTFKIHKLEHAYYHINLIFCDYRHTHGLKIN